MRIDVFEAASTSDHRPDRDRAAGGVRRRRPGRGRRPHRLGGAPDPGRGHPRPELRGGSRGRRLLGVLRRNRVRHAPRVRRHPLRPRGHPGRRQRLAAYGLHRGEPDARDGIGNVCRPVHDRHGGLPGNQWTPDLRDGQLCRRRGVVPHGRDRDEPGRDPEDGDPLPRRRLLPAELRLRVRQRRPVDRRRFVRRGVDDGNGNTVPGPRIEQWFPLSAGSHYLEDDFGSVWATIGAQTPLHRFVRAMRELRGQRRRPELGPDAADRWLRHPFAPHGLLSARPGTACRPRRPPTRPRPHPAAPTDTRSRSTTRTSRPSRSTPSRTRSRTASPTRPGPRPARPPPTRRSPASSSAGRDRSRCRLRATPRSTSP